MDKLKEVSQIYFPSKRNPLYSILIWGTALVAFCIFIFLTVYYSEGFYIFLGLIGLVIAVFLIWLSLGTGYKIENNIVIVKHGPIKQVVHIDEIKEIRKRKGKKPTTEKLIINYSVYNLSTIVSPSDEYEFLRILLNKNPKIELDSSIVQMYQF